MFEGRPCYVIVVAGGAGTRFGGDVPKQFLPLGGVPVILHSLRVFQKMDEVDGVVLVVPGDWRGFCEDLAAEHGLTKVTSIVAGGASRQESVYGGLLEVKGDAIVAIHDAARPFVCKDAVLSVIAAAGVHKAATLALSATDTIKMADAEGNVMQTLPRENLYTIQTPQAFCKGALMAAHDGARREGFLGTDDCQLMERAGIRPKIVIGNGDNMKITNVMDLGLAEYLMGRL
ncbi:MAG: 2-C-methyl-D-erythritol 4-phosphate cytidylyltransferase [Defluviitaleaceae bacterium]|nr:2-C-methyl-D-erythritol 4-phosphate cytidylyltransferase [Defluviitaleaceae bacterium]